MAARAGRRGPAPIASFDHDVSDESSPEAKPPLAGIREDPGPRVAALGVPEGRARSQSTPGPSAPRIDISRASSSSHHDSRDSSPELALFAGASSAGKGELGFKEDGALDLRSSTEELAFLEGAPGGAAVPPPPPAPLVAPSSRRHSRKDSQSSEAALLAVSGRTSRLSSVGSHCSAQSRGSRLSTGDVDVDASRSPSPHKMLLETSFCGPKPIESDPDACAAKVEEHLLEMAKATLATATPPAPAPVPAPAGDARDHREVRTEVTVESAPRAPQPRPSLDGDKQRKESSNRARVEERRARPRERRDRSEPEVYKSRNKSKDIIRIRLKPSEEYDDDDESESTACAAGGDEERGALVAERPSRLSEARSLSPSPAAATGAGGGGGGGGGTGGGVSRKSSFCSLFKSRETIASPDTHLPFDALRKKSVGDGRERSKSRERAQASASASARLRGSLLSLFRTPRRSGDAQTESSSRCASPAPPATPAPADRSRRGTAERLKYYEDARDGIIHIPLRTPPDERPSAPHEQQQRPASAPSASFTPAPAPAPVASTSCVAASAKPVRRTVLPDGSIIIPLHSPTEKVAPCDPLQANAPDRDGDAERSRSADCERAVDAARSTERPASEVRSESRDESRGDSRGESASARTSMSSGADEAAAAPITDTGATPTTTTTTTTTAPANGCGSSGRRQRLVFTTHVGSAEQVFSTQLSLTKTPSVASEISEAAISLAEDRPLRDSHIASPAVPASSAASPSGPSLASAASPSAGRTRTSSSSDGSSDARADATDVVDAEARGLVVQESFEEELPYVPTTLPLERPLALPMVPVRERAAILHPTASVERPRASSSRGAGPVPPALPPAAAPPPAGAKLQIRLPSRGRASTASAPAPAPQPPPPSSRPRTTSQGDGAGAGHGEWVDFASVPERRKAAKRIQTLPPGAAEAAGVSAVAAVGGEGPLLSFVPADECRCECHHASDDAHEGRSRDADRAGSEWAPPAAAPPPRRRQ